MSTKFGTVAVREVYRGQKVAWYFDQTLASIFVSQWERQRGHHRVKRMPRDTTKDRQVPVTCDQTNRN